MFEDAKIYTRQNDCSGNDNHDEAVEEQKILWSFSFSKSFLEVFNGSVKGANVASC